MVDIDVIYEAVSTAATHGPPSGEAATDAPADNHRRGESFHRRIIATGSAPARDRHGDSRAGKQWNLDGSRIHLQKR
jgi:hypothetical protein